MLPHVNKTFVPLILDREEKSVEMSQSKKALGAETNPTNWRNDLET